MKNWWLLISVVGLACACSPRNKGVTEQSSTEQSEKIQSAADSNVNEIRHGSANQQELDSLKKAKLKAKGIR
jgi:hypothetical protein